MNRAKPLVVAALAAATLFGPSAGGTSAAAASPPGGAGELAADQPGATMVSGAVHVCAINRSVLPELSGLAASVNFPGILWTHNDSGDTARVFALDSRTCAIRAVVRLAGVTALDFESISVGPNGSGKPVVWVGDTGDNGHQRRNVKLYRFAEPTVLRSQTVNVRTVTTTWSDGARDCESLIVEPARSGRVFLVSKEAKGGVYRLRGDFRRTGVAATGTRVAPARSFATDAATSPNGATTVMRSGDYATVLSGLPGTNPTGITLPAQTQGEAVTFSRDGRYVFIASEGGGDLIRIPAASL